jgi:hypothetical protein
MTRIIVVVAALLTASSGTWAQGAMPSDIDLKTAYCLRVKQRQQEWSRKLMSEQQPSSAGYAYLQKSVRDTEADLDRLRTYLIPKIPMLDITGIVLATNRADKDVGEALSSATEQCLQTCAPAMQGGQMTPEWNTCITDCSAKSPVSVRIHSCTDVNWLPF